MARVVKPPTPAPLPDALPHKARKREKVVEAPAPKKKKVFEIRIPGIRFNGLTGKMTKHSGAHTIDHDTIIRLVYDKKESPFVKIEVQSYDNKRRHLLPDRLRLPYVMWKKIYAVLSEFFAGAEDLLRKRKVKPQKWEA